MKAVASRICLVCLAANGRDLERCRRCGCTFEQPLDKLRQLVSHHLARTRAQLWPSAVFVIACLASTSIDLWFGGLFPPLLLLTLFRARRLVFLRATLASLDRQLPEFPTATVIAGGQTGKRADG
jgi:hypothetical protein